MNTITTTDEFVDPELAKSWVDSYAYGKQRALHRLHVDNMAQEMRRGAFPQDTQIKLACIGGQWAILDGQHRLRAVAESGVRVRFVVTRYSSLTPEEAADVYGKTDTGGKIRTFFDDVRVHEIPESTGLNMTNLNTLGAAVEFMLKDFKRQPRVYVSRDAKRAMCVAWAPQFRRYTEIIRNNTNVRQWMMRSPVVAVAIKTIGAVEDAKCEPFWKGCAEDDGLRVGDPRKALINWMRNSSVTGRTLTASGHARVANNNEQARAAAQAWNAFYDGRSIAFVRILDGTSPIVIRGTELDGKDND